MVTISGGYNKLKAWVTSLFTAHTALPSAHHAKYLNSEAVAAVLTDDTYVKNTGDRIIGNFEMWANLYTDKYLYSEKNLFLGIDVCGAGNLSNGSSHHGWWNVGIGWECLYYITTGNCNFALGARSLKAITSGRYNVSIGVNAMLEQTIGNFNVGFGGSALGLNISGDCNMAIGTRALYYMENGDNNVGIGTDAGKGTTKTNRSGGIFIGHEAGKNVNASNRLYIHNSASATPLLYGEFNIPLLKIHGYLYLPTILSGATQAGAGASANEVWKTSGHATLPDNVLMIGV